MKKEINVISPKSAEYLRLLGIRWKPAAWWKANKNGTFKLVDNVNPYDRNVYPAYNNAELGHLIPAEFFNQMRIIKVLNFFKIQLGEDKWETLSSEAEARAMYLIHLITTGKATIVNRTPAENDAQDQLFKELEQ